MSISLRILLIAGALLAFFFMALRIRANQAKSEVSVFWLMFSLTLLILGIFPGIASFVSQLLQVQSPSNLVFLVVIFLLMIRIFLMDMKISKLRMQTAALTQKIAVDSARKAEETRPGQDAAR